MSEDKKDRVPLISPSELMNYLVDSKWRLTTDEKKKRVIDLGGGNRRRFSVKQIQDMAKMPIDGAEKLQEIADEVASLATGKTVYTKEQLLSGEIPGTVGADGKLKPGFTVNGNNGVVIMPYVGMVFGGTRVFARYMKDVIVIAKTEKEAEAAAKRIGK